MKKMKTGLTLKTTPLFGFRAARRSTGAPSTDPTLTTITITTTGETLPAHGIRHLHAGKSYGKNFQKAFSGQHG